MEGLMSRTIAILPSLLLLAALPPLAGFGAEDGKPALELRYTFGKGDRYVLSAELTSELDGGGAHRTQERYTLDCVVESADEERAKLKIVFKDVAYSDKLLKSKYDSRRKKETDDKPAFPYSRLVGRSVTVTMDRKGKIESLQGMNDLARDARDAFTKKFPIYASVGGKVVDVFFEGFDNVKFSEKLQLFFLRLPDEPVGKGGKWKIEFLTHIYKYVDVRYRFEHTVSSLKGKAGARISLGGEVWRNKASKVPLVANKVSGSAEFDARKGGMKSKTLTIDYTSVNQEKEKTRTKKVFKTVTKKYKPGK
jgi:hypothetical protein